jgi:hypothetical protein
LIQRSNSFLNYLAVLREPKIVIGTKIDDLLAIDIGHRAISNHSPKTTVQPTLLKRVKPILNEGGLMA